MARTGWSLDASKWKRLAAYIDGKEWKKIRFDESMEAQVDCRPGVYMIVANPPCLESLPHTQFMAPLYAGQSKTNIRSRFHHHLTTPDAQVRELGNLGGCSNLWFYFTVVSPREVDALEALLIDCYGPSANSQRGIQGKLKDPISAG